MESARPLSTAEMHILLAIGPEVRHGYAIMAEIERLTDGHVRVRPGTLYTAIARLLDEGLIEEASPPADSTTLGPPRRYYRLSAQGLDAATDEVRRLERVVTRTRGWAGGRS